MFVVKTGDAFVKFRDSHSFVRVARPERATLFARRVDAERRCDPDNRHWDVTATPGGPDPWNVAYEPLKVWVVEFPSYTERPA